MRHNAPTGVEVAPESKEDLTLGHTEVVPGSGVLHADLYVPGGESKGFSSGGRSSETRNILFIDPGQKAAHWLLPDNEHVIAEKTDISDEKDPLTKRIIATVVFVKPPSQDDEPLTGQLLLIDTDGKRTTEIATDVADLHLATMNDDKLIVIYERDKRLVLATFDPRSLSKKSEQNVEIPQLK